MFATVASQAKVEPYGYNDAGGFYNVLPAGEAGTDTASQLAEYELTGRPPPHFDDQAPLYQNLLYADPTLTDAQVPDYFKDASFGAMAELCQWHDAGGHRRDLTRSGHDQFTPAIEVMDAWWPKLVAAEFEPMLGSGAMSRIEALNPIGGISDNFTEGWYGYVSKDLRRAFGVSERAPYSQIYCGNLPQGHFSPPALRTRCALALQRSLAGALKVTPKQLYGSICPKDPQPACADEDRYTGISAIDVPPFPFQNRPTFQQVVMLTRHLTR